MGVVWFRREATKPEENLRMSLRRSRRAQKMCPDKLDISSLEFSDKRKEEMRQLLTVGGHGGRTNKKDEDWNFEEFQDTQFRGFYTLREAHENINEVQKHVSDEDDNKQCSEVNEHKGTYQILANTQLRELEKHMSCKQCTHQMVRQERLHAVQSFLQILKDNKNENYDYLFDLWKQKEQQEETNVRYEDKKHNCIHLHFTHRGLATEVSTKCQECSSEHKIPPKKSSQYGLDWNQQPTRRWNNSWYDLNLRAVLATLAIGGGGSDLSDFLSFIDIPNCASFGYNAFNRIDALIGRSL